MSGGVRWQRCVTDSTEAAIMGFLKYDQLCIQTRERRVVSRSQHQQNLDQRHIIMLIATQLRTGRDVASPMTCRSRTISDNTVTSSKISVRAAVFQFDVLPDQRRDKAVAFLGYSGERTQVLAWDVRSYGECEFFGKGQEGRALPRGIGSSSVAHG